MKKEDKTKEIVVPGIDNTESKRSIVELLEENPTLFYDASELDNLDGHGTNDEFTQKTIQEWEAWIEEYYTFCVTHFVKPEICRIFAA